MSQNVKLKHNYYGFCCLGAQWCGDSARIVLKRVKATKGLLPGAIGCGGRSPKKHHAEQLGYPQKTELIKIVKVKPAIGFSY